MMPKSTAAIRPSLSTNRFPGCMSAWKKPSRSAWRRNVCISARPSAGRSSPRASSAARLESGVPSIHSSVSTVRAVRSQSTAGTRKSGSSFVLSRISAMAAASSRRSISIVTERASVSTTSMSRSRRASAEWRSALRAAKYSVSRSDLKRRSMPGRSTFTASVCPSASALCTCAIEAAATAGPNEANSSRSGLPSAAATVASASRLRERRHLVLQRFQIARERGPDDVGTRREELAELHVGRPEPRQRGGELDRGARVARPLEQPRELQPKPRGSGQGRGIDQAEHALAREHEARAREPKQMADCSDHKRQPECSATMPPLIGAVRHARKARGAHHLGERVRAREAADRIRPDSGRARHRPRWRGRAPARR